jgi:hypothetical protein
MAKAQEEEQDAPHHQIKFPDLTKSTIYRRHEARLAKSYALQEDPRPALLRVLSGLPGFSMLILPYDPASMNNNNSNNNNTSTTTLDAPITGIYSEETLFATSESRKAMTSSNGSGPSTNSSATSTKALQAMVAAGMASGVAETLFGAHHHHAAKTATPFSNATTTNHSRVFATLHPTTDGSMSLFMNSSKSARPTLSKVSTAAATAARPLLLMSVTSTSLLFGSKTFLQPQRKDGKESSSIISTVLSSGVAGALVGGVQGAMADTWQAPKPAHALWPSSSVRMPMPPSMAQTMTHASLSAIVLFTTFEQVQRLFVAVFQKQDHQTRSSSSSWMTTAGAGAIAGVASTLVTSQLSNNTATATATATTIRLTLVPTLLRSAPKYALLFSGYQQVLQAMQTNI